MSTIRDDPLHRGFPPTEQGQIVEYVFDSDGTILGRIVVREVWVPAKQARVRWNRKAGVFIDIPAVEGYMKEVVFWERMDPGTR